MSAAGRPRLLLLTVGLGVGGAEEILRRSLPGLRDEGFEVTLASLKGGGARGEEPAWDGSGPQALGGSGPWNPAPLARLWSKIRRGRFDVIHSHLYWANLAVRLTAAGAGSAAIVNSHHGTDAWLPASRRFLERATFFLADRLVVCSEAVRRCAVEKVGLPPERIVTVPNGVEVERFMKDGRRDPVRSDLGLTPGQVVVGCVGRLDEPVKGLSVLIEAMVEVRRSIPGAVCLMIGAGPGRPRLEAMARCQEPSGGFRFLGERADVPDLLQALDLYVQPSRLEGFGLAALEAMAAGKAVVASRAGGLPEVVEEGVTGDLVPPGDAGALAAAITRLLQDADRRERYGRAGRERAREKFPLRGMVRGWTNLYRELLSGSGSRRAA
jgi:glycosyltransferase involved in cell wall biosynthesis